MERLISFFRRAVPRSSSSKPLTESSGAGHKRKATASAEGERPHKRRSTSPNPSHEGMLAGRGCSRRIPTDTEFPPLRNQRGAAGSRKRSREPDDESVSDTEAPSPKRLMTPLIASGVSARPARRCRSIPPRRGMGAVVKGVRFSSVPAVGLDVSHGSSSGPRAPTSMMDVEEDEREEEEEEEEGGFVRSMAIDLTEVDRPSTPSAGSDCMDTDSLPDYENDDDLEMTEASWNVDWTSAMRNAAIFSAMKTEAQQSSDCAAQLHLELENYCNSQSQQEPQSLLTVEELVQSAQNHRLSSTITTPTSPLSQNPQVESIITSIATSQQPTKPHSTPVTQDQQQSEIKDLPVAQSLRQSSATDVAESEQQLGQDQRESSAEPQIVNLPHSAAPSPRDAVQVFQTSAPEPPTFSEEELKAMMAAYEAGGGAPIEADIELLRMMLDDEMEIDGGDDHVPETKSIDIRARIRAQRDEDARKARELDRTRRQEAAKRIHQDEAPAPQPSSHISVIADHDIDQHYYDAQFLASEPESLEAEKARFREADEHWKKIWPEPHTFTTEHWIREAQIFHVNKQRATNARERTYWSNREIEAECYARKEFEDGKGQHADIRFALFGWKKNLAAALADAATAQKVGDLSLTDLQDGQAAAVQPDAQAAVRAKLAPFLKQLPPELDEKVTKILNVSTPGKEVAKSVDGVILQRKDIATILHAANFYSRDPEGWLNDEIINAFFSALVNALNDKAGYVKGKVPPYAAYVTGWLAAVSGTGKSIKNIERWSRRKGIKGEKLLQCKRIFFPVNPGNHWSLLVICPELHVIEYLDSLDTGTSPTNRKSNRWTGMARDWLKMELGENYVEDEWTVVDRRSSIQDNGSDCGMFTCLNGLASALDLESPMNEFGPAQIPHARRALISMLDLGGFSNHFEL